MNYQKIMDDILNTIDKNNPPKLLLHACCGPCSSYVLEYLSNFFNITIYYYNPNIEPITEFNKRVDEVKKLISLMPLKNKVDVVVPDYNNNDFKIAIKGHEKDLEGQERCYICYKLRMEQACIYAKDNNYDFFTTTLSISPYKNSTWLNQIGEELHNKYNINYLYADFKKKNGYKRSIELSKIYNLYRQDYCGCIYSKYQSMIKKGEKNEK